MSRAISAPIVTSNNMQESPEGYVWLLTFTHATLMDPIRVCSAQSDFRSNNETYLACPFQMDGVPETADAPPQVQLTIQNVDRRIVEALRSIPPGQGQLGVITAVVTTLLPDTVEYGPHNFTMKSATYNRIVVTGDLSFENILSEPASWARFTPNDHPAMY